MAIERERRPFWIHQVVEYIVGIALISAAAQMPRPAVPALLGLLVIINAAVAKGSAGAFRLVGRRLHRVLDLVVIGVLVFFALQPWVSVDSSSRLLIGGVAFVLWFVWFYTDFAERPTRAQRKAAKGPRGPRDSTEMGRQAGRYAKGAVHMVKQMTRGDEQEAAPAPPAAQEPAAPPAAWDPPSAQQ